MSFDTAVLRPYTFVFGVTDGMTDAPPAHWSPSSGAYARYPQRAAPGVCGSLEARLHPGSRHPDLPRSKARNCETSGPSSSAEVSRPRWPSS